MVSLKKIIKNNKNSKIEYADIDLRMNSSGKYILTK